MTVNASRGLALVEIIGPVDWVDLSEAQGEAAKLLTEKPVSWVYDYTRAQIRESGELTSDGLKHHQVDGGIEACAVIVPDDDMSAWQAHLREIRTLGRHRALFAAEDKRDAMLWAALQAQHLRHIEGEPLSSIPGELF